MALITFGNATVDANAVEGFDYVPGPAVRVGDAVAEGTLWELRIHTKSGNQYCAGYFGSADAAEAALKSHLETLGR